MKKYSLSDGYTHGSVNDFLQGENGIMWMCSRDGLIQFDGYTFRNYKTYVDEELLMGLSNITDIFENSEGDIWCLCNDGRVCLFDIKIKRFLNVIPTVINSDTINERVVNVVTLRKGISWIVYENGIIVRVNDILCKQNAGITKYRLKGEFVYRIFEDQDGDEWILSDKGISIIGEKSFKDSVAFIHATIINNEIWLSDKGKNFGKYDKESACVERVDLSINIDNVVMFQSIKNNKIAIGTTNTGLILYDILNKTFKIINVNISPQSKNEVFSLFEDSQNDLWMSNRHNGVIYYDREKEKISVLQSPSNIDIDYENENKFMVREDGLGNVWVIPKGGSLCYFDRKTNNLRYYYTNDNTEHSVIAPYMDRYFQDRQKNIWFDDGYTLNKLSFFESNFSVLPLQNGELLVRSLLFDQNENLWVGIKNNYLKIYTKNNDQPYYVNEKGEISLTPQKFKGNVYSMFLDDENHIWVGTRLNGLYLFEYQKGQSLSFNVKHFRNNINDKYSLSNDCIYSLLEDSQKRIWIGTYGGGLNYVIKTPNDNYQFINANNKLTTYPIDLASRVRHISSINDSVMLVATTNGLISFSSDFSNAEEIKFYRNTRNVTSTTTLTNNDIFYSLTDNQHNTYVIARNGGINQITSDNLLSNDISFNSYTKNDGLLSDLTLSMVEDTCGGIWIISQQGLSRFYEQQRKIDHYNRFISKQNITFSEAQPVVSPSANIMMGTDKGVLEFNPYNKHQNTISPYIVYTNIELQGSPLTSEIENLDSIVMKPGQRNISVQFAALDYREPSQIQYAYRMEGVDINWHYVGRERTANYINLSHGIYDLSVKSTNSEGIWCDNIRTLTIIVKPKFYETIWARILFLVLFVIVVTIIVYVLFTFYRLRHAVEVEQKIADLKLNFFTVISHELRTPLTLIVSPLDELIRRDNLSENVKKHLTLVKRNTDRMLRMVNQILDIRKLQFEKMQLLVENVEVVEFVKHIMEGFKLISNDKAINFFFHTNAELIYLWVDKDKFEKIIFNLLSNAFKYTNSGKSISIDIQQIQNEVKISIIDQGIGISEKNIGSLFNFFESGLNKENLKSSSGIGLSLVKDFVELHHGEISVESRLEKGSEFTVTFKQGKEHLIHDKHVEFILDDYVETKDNHTTVDELSCDDSDDIKDWSILIVEDNIELLSFLTDILRDSYKVLTAQNGEEGYEIAVSMLPDIIVTDVMMPVKDGLTMIQEIKENKEICHTPIIILSTRSSIENQIQGIEHGIDDYISKPFSASLLKARIRSLILQRKSLQEAYMLAIGNGGLFFNKDLLPLKPQITSDDDIFITNVMQFMEDNMDNTSLRIDDFVSEFSMSRAVFFKKMKMLLGITPVNFVKEIRIKHSTQLIESGLYSVADIAYRCGFSDPNYFTKCFKKQIGISPTEYMNKTK